MDKHAAQETLVQGQIYLATAFKIAAAWRQLSLVVTISVRPTFSVCLRQRPE